MSQTPAIVWLRDDLRLDDQPALAASAGRPVLIVYVLEETETFRLLGGASRWWLARSLASLADDIAAIGGRLDIVRGRAEAILPRIAQACGAREAFWTRRYGASQIAVDTRIKATLLVQGCKASSFNGQLLREPWEVVTREGAPFRVFSAF
ncbi:deoxyribodipyrimidine photo-lyase [Methylocapsa sp. S129]|uniref:deoxyribodipyrimidine photo-lyase n=1 Tax=Methylocapsa sp. S129 TaxID=1641869 RepID=UPI00352BCCE1